MSHIVYNLTTIIDHSVHEEWLGWMKSVYLPAAMATDLFIESKMLKILEDHNPDGFTYAIQFTSSTFAEYIDFQNKYAGRFDEMMKQNFEGKYASFTTSMKLVV
jgi:hypothetical protein